MAQGWVLKAATPADKPLCFPLYFFQYGSVAQTAFTATLPNSYYGDSDWSAISHSWGRAEDFLPRRLCFPLFLKFHLQTRSRTTFEIKCVYYNVVQFIADKHENVKFW